MNTRIYDMIDTENGVKFHVNRMEDNLLIDDINVKPGIKTVKFDFGDIQELIDEDACKELGYSIDYVTEEYLEEYIYFFRSKHSQLADYYDYMGYSYY